ncbi:MAG: ferritin-like domain-containing protein [Azospirillaceae bacterium]
MTDTASLPATLAEAALTVLGTADARAKAALGRALAAAWHDGAIATIGQVADAALPDRPARPARPELRLPRDMPRRRKGFSQAGRIALLHALAHIELNAIDLAWDVIARFCHAGRAGMDLPPAFADDWVRVGDEEGRHFLLLSDRLAELGAAYGDLPAHDGLWEASAVTAGNLAARLAVVPMVLEARGLDVTPAMIANLRRAGDDASAGILQVIHDDEIGHVAIGRRWFEHVCTARGLPPVETWQSLVRRYFKGDLKRPFNHESRGKAGFASAFYEPLGVG